MADFAPPGAAAPLRCAFDPATLTLSGRLASPGASLSGLTVSVFVDGATTTAGTATTAGDGTWSLTLAGLTAGPHSFLAKATVPAQGTASGTVGGAPVTLASRPPLFAFGLLGAAAA